MSKELIKNFLTKKKGSSRIRILIGRNRLYTNSSRNIIEEMYHQLSITDLKLFKSEDNKKYHHSKNFYLKLKILKKINKRQLNRKIFYSAYRSSSKISNALPGLYLKVIKDKTNLSVSYSYSFFKFQYLVIKEGILGVFTFLRHIKFTLRDKYIKRKDGIYFYDFNSSLIDQNNHKVTEKIIENTQTEIKRVIINSSFKTEFRNLKFKDKEIIFSNYPYGPISSYFNFLKFVISSIFIIMHSIIFLVIGKWHMSFMLSDLIKENYVSFVEKFSIPSLVLQSQSDFLSRELWTSNDCASSCDFGLFFYATSIIPLYFENKHHDSSNYWNVMNWDSAYMQIDQNIEFIKNNNKYIKKYINIGSFSWKSNKEKFDFRNNELKNSIVLFDLTPHHHYTQIANSEIRDWRYPFQSSRLMIKILSEISEDLGLSLIVKLKRRSRFNNHRYLNYISSIPNISVVSEVDSFKLANEAFCSVSACFTSTAFLDTRGRSCYFDPMNSLVDKYFLAKNINLFRSKLELKNWILSLDDAAID